MKKITIVFLFVYNYSLMSMDVGIKYDVYYSHPSDINEYTALNHNHYGTQSFLTMMKKRYQADEYFFRLRLPVSDPLNTLTIFDKFLKVAHQFSHESLTWDLLDDFTQNVREPLERKNAQLRKELEKFQSEVPKEYASLSHSEKMQQWNKEQAYIQLYERLVDCYKKVEENPSVVDYFNYDFVAGLKRPVCKAFPPITTNNWFNYRKTILALTAITSVSTVLACTALFSLKK